MINKSLNLSEKIFAPDIERAPTRDGFGKGTVAAGKENPNVVVLSADLTESTRAEWFKKEFPDRFIEIGVAEQNLATVGAGLAAVGKVPFVASYAAFSPGRNYEQIRTTIALNEVPVVVCGMHAGVSVGPDGATHQMLEDIGLMRMLPHMSVINPSDALEAERAVVAVARSGKPAYVRFGRSGVPTYTTAETPFEIGKAYVLWESAKPRVSILTTGSVAYEALLAARTLAADAIEVEVISFPTIKPLDVEAVSAAARRSGMLITVEEHQIAGGFGSAVCEHISETHPVPVRRLGISDQFGQSGEPEELLEHYGLTATDIAKNVREMLRVG